ncbi:MAG: hypothetical protein L0241_13635 [Planctomycetia bacterium]|nr:hypothetical protein [Planctomycetia bacterium]
MSRPTLARVAALAILLFSAPVATAQDQYQPILGGLSARCIGPANMGGRITDLAVVDDNPNLFYVAAAGGGVWKTTDGGNTFKPVFNDQPTQCIGAVAVCQAKPDVVYVGTGEPNPRNSVSWGSGVYKSVDGGKSWKHCGLADTHHIGRVVVHPANPDIAYVGALGHFWGPNKERGLYKTTDGGKSWECVKFIDENTGFVDLQMDPSEPDTLYAAAWELRRDGFSGGSPRVQVGVNGGLFKTTDGGKTWERMAGGLPEKVGYGRCGLSIYKKDPNVVFAIVHTSETAGQLSNAGQPATRVNKGGKVGPLGRVETGGVFRSDDKGKTWKKVNDLVPRPFYYGQIRVDPNDEKRVYVLGVSLVASSDGAQTFTGISRSIHPDHHAMWINPKNSDHLIVGNDGGLYISKDRGKTFAAKRDLVISQFYGVAVDMRTPYRVYGGLQDNGSWGGTSATPYEDGITLADWRRFLGGDGFQAAVDPTDFNTVYLESQYGALSRINLATAGAGGVKGGGARPIRPPAPKGGPRNRYNWNAPILLSPHDPKTLYYGGQFLFKSVNRGDAWTKISPELTAPKEGPPSPGYTILALTESPVKAGVLWVGTDDGRVWVSKEDGKEWAEVTDKIPDVPLARAIPKIECSYFDAGTAMVVIDRHRNDDFKPYIYLTTDYGETWKPIAGNLPPGAVVGVVRQSSKDKNLLFVGTEIGLFVTFDGGTKWHHLAKTGMPQGVRVDDLVIHPRDRDLVIATHGRGIWVMDIAPLEQLSDAVLKADVHLFDVKPVTLLKPQKRTLVPLPGFKVPNPSPGIHVHLLTTAKTAGKLEVTCTNPAGKRTGLYLGKDIPGLDSCVFEANAPGEYTITLKAGGVTQTKKAVVKAPEEPKKKVDE